MSNDDQQKTQAIPSLEDILKADRKDPSFDASEEDAAPTEAIDFGALMASGALPGLEPQDLDLPKTEMPAPAQMPDFGAPVEDAAPIGGAPDHAPPSPFGEPSFGEPAPAPAPAPETPLWGASEPEPAPPMDAAPVEPPQGPPMDSFNASAPDMSSGSGGAGFGDSSFGGGSGGGGGGFSSPPPAMPEENSKKTLYIALGIGAFFFFCCCPLAGIGGFMAIGAQSASNAIEDYEPPPSSYDEPEPVPATPTGNETTKEPVVKAEAPAVDTPLSTKRAAVASMTPEKLKRKVKVLGWKIIGDPKVVNGSLSLPITKGAVGGAATVNDFPNEFAAKTFTKTMHENPDAVVVRSGKKTVAVIMPGNKPKAIDLSNKLLR